MLQAESLKVRPLHLYPRNHNRLVLPRPRRLGDARRELQRQLVALHPAKPHSALHGARRPGARPDGWLGNHVRCDSKSAFICGFFSKIPHFFHEALVECKLLGRRAVGVDINRDAVMVARNRLDISYAPLDAGYVAPEIKTYVGDARSPDLIGSETIDLIATHPPYASIIPYSHDERAICQACITSRSLQRRLGKSQRSACACSKPGKHCAMLMGDTRRNKHFVPITPRVLMSFLEAGFILREDIIKLQWKMKSTREKWFGKKYDFYLIGHEHLYVFRKPDAGERVTKFKESMKWW